MQSRQQPVMRLRTGKEGVATGRCLVALVFLLTFPSLARPQASAPPTGRPSGDYTIRVNADSVVLQATVRNHNGTPVSGLSKENFQVYEDGALQQIEYYGHDDIPVTVGLVVDNSGSMRTKRPERHSRRLGVCPLQQSARPDVRRQFQRACVVWPSRRHALHGPSRAIAIGPVENYRHRRDGALRRCGGGVEHLKQGNRDKKVLIVVSDGGDNASHHTLDQVATLAGQSDAIIYTIDISVPEDPDRNPNALRRLAKVTGGEAFSPETLEEVAPICERIAQDIRSQYTLAYTPANTKSDGAYRTIQVKTTGHGRLTVRTRAGYYAPSKPQALPAIAGSQTSHP